MLPVLKNKFFIAFAVFVVYGAFLDEYDMFTIISQRSKLNKLEKAKVAMSKDLVETKETLSKLKYRSEVERYAREKTTKIFLSFLTNNFTDLPPLS